MSPKPENVGPGLVSVEQEARLEVNTEETDTILRNAINNIRTQGNIVFTGLIVERERLSTGGSAEYIHPVIEIMERDSQEGIYEELVLGGPNFERLFPLNLSTGTVIWGEGIGSKQYTTVKYRDQNPLADFFNGGVECMFLDLSDLKDQLLKQGKTKDIENINKGRISHYLLPKTVNTRVKLESSQKILSAVRAAAGIK